MLGLIRSYLHENDGQFAMIMAIAAVPLLMCTSYVIDIQRAGSANNELQNALDAATLAAVTKGNLTKQARGDYAKAHFTDNYKGDMDVSLKAKVTESQVTLSAKGGFPVTLNFVPGLDKIDISESSTAELIKETVTCLLVLSKHNKQALTFGGTSVFDSPDCAIQVNSDHPQALWGGSDRPPVAKDICVTGGYYGRFATHVKTECRPIEDPYKDVTIPEPEGCKSLNGVTLDSQRLATTYDGIDLMVKNYTSNYEQLNPGNYCGGLQIDGRTVLRPGIYHITDGPLIIGENADVFGDDVTFVLNGAKSRLHMLRGAKMNITATKKGDFGGVAFYQVPSGARWPENQSLVLSGGDLTVNGVFYFPTHAVHIQGTSQVGATAKATSFIAQTLKIDAEVKTTVNVDHKAAGLPPLHPRTDEGARLVSK